MESKHHIYLPAQFSIDAKVHNNRVRQLLRPAFTGEATVTPYSTGASYPQLVTRDDGSRIIVASGKATPPETAEEFLRVPDDGLLTKAEMLTSKAQWLKPAAIPADSDGLAEWRGRGDAVRSSWKGDFSFREECYEGGRIVEEGLRGPQIGALHATLAHWKVTNDPGTVVMPTGTGKTETMLAVLTYVRLERLLVVVPNAALRDQIAAKFITLGLLKKLGVLGPSSLYPIVGLLEHRLQTPEEVDAYFGCCNVVVSTMNVINGSSDEVQRRIADVCTHLFVDEAHHVSAPTWAKFRLAFLHKTTLQFTATPFRNDGKHVDGKIIFNYPLRKAQEEGYFKRINFIPLRVYNYKQADVEIASAAVRQLKADLDDELDHLVMARAVSIDRAKEVHDIYQRYAAEYKPILIHSKQSDSEKREALRQLRQGESRILVCVNMFGEGFDLPELKIAALHDTHKSLAVTLQFTGRFTRTKPKIGDATVIANIAGQEVDEVLRDLYAEDADWNYLLRRLSEGATGRQVKRSEFLEGFTDPPDEIPLQNIFPKMSTIVYRTNCTNWRPDKIDEVVDDTRLFVRPTINHKHRVLLFVTREYEFISWGDVKGIYNTSLDLYLLHWDKVRKLLFIYSSNKDSSLDYLAEAVAGDDVEMIRGEQVFRSLYNVNRLIPMTLGLKHSLSHAVRFTQHMGASVREGLSEASLENRFKSNIFGRGFENGERTSAGCSRKGRIWAHKVAYDIAEWVDWCHDTGAKLIDESISVADIMDHVIVAEQITNRPELVPVTIEWSEDFLHRSEDAIEVDVAGDVVPFFDVGMELVDHKKDGSLRFRVFTEDKSVEYQVSFRRASVEFVPTGTESVDMVVSKRRKSLSDWFQQEPPVIRFEDGAFLIYNEFFKVKSDNRAPFDRERLDDTWDWNGIDLKKESQKLHKRPDSIQRRVIEHLLASGHDPHYDIVFDDDASNEAADVVALKVAGEKLLVHLFHCKFSTEEKAGARVEDMYAVCGQAQRSVFWRTDLRGLLDHLSYRDARRLEKHSVSRFERGDQVRLDEIARQSPYLTPEFKIFVVQPGLAKSKAEVSQLELLAVTELYLRETYGVDFGVITNK